MYIPEELLAKYKALFPDNVEAIVVRKDDYDRLYGDLTIENIELQQEIERLNNIIKKALHKLRASEKHFKTERENNVITFTIRILKGEDKE